MGENSDARTVLFISPIPPPAGGIATWTKAILEKGFSSKYKVDILDISIHFTKLLLLNQIRRTISIFIRLIWTLGSGKIALVHLNTSMETRGIYRDYISAVIVKCFKKPLVVHYHCDCAYYLIGKSRFKRDVANKLFKIADKNIVLSASSLEFIRKAGFEATVVGNFIADDEFEIKGEYVKENREKVIGLFVGIIGIRKGSDLLIRTAKNYPNVNFKLVGRFVDGFECLKEVASGNVEFVEEVSREKVFNFCKEADFFILPALSEGFPLVLLEAMVCSLPVLSTKVGAISEMIDDGLGGILVDPGSEEQLKSALDWLLANKDRFEAMGQYNLNKVKNNYTYSIITQKYEELYDQLVAGAPKNSC